MTIVSTPYAFAALRRDGSLQVASYLGHYSRHAARVALETTYHACTYDTTYYLLLYLPLQAWGSISWGGGEGAPTDSGYSRFALSTSGVE